MSGHKTRQPTGVPGLDYVLGGGIIPGSSILVRGAAGTGKTTLGLQFLCEGARTGEGGIYISFEEFPEQIYQNAAEFGLDLPALERAGKLQVVSLSAEVLIREATAPGGLLEELKNETDFRRVVIDSVTVLEMTLADDADRRRSVYRLRNALHRLGATTLLLEEGLPDPAGSSASEYVADTVIYLTFDEFEEYRMRHLEVRKHRGSAFQPGRHVFVFSKAGIRVLPALDRVPDLTVADVVPIGLPPLDRCLGGGLPRGTAVTLNVNSKCNYRYLLGAIVSAHLRQGDGFLSGRSATLPPSEVANLLKLYGFDAARLGAEGRWRDIEFTQRPVPPELEPYVTRVPTEAEAHKAAVDEIILSLWRGVNGTGRRWLTVTDMNTVVRQVGEELVMREWSERVAQAKHYGSTIVVICNFEEMGSAMAAFLQRTAAVILRTWFDGRYQYLQVQKAPSGRVSEPMVIEYTETPPYMVLW